MLSMLTSFRAQLLKEMHDRLMMGGKARLESGKFWASYRLYGYDMVDGKRVVNEYEAEWVRKIFEWYTGVKIFYLLRGLLKCAHCERGWEVKGLRYKYKNGQRTERKTILRYYRCHFGANHLECPHKTPIRAEVLEEAVWGEISQLLKSGMA
jgi:hypothetical protein